MADQDSPKPPDRSRRAVILATVGIVVILAAAFFFAAVVAPFLHTRKVVRNAVSTHHVAVYGRDSSHPVVFPGRGDEEIIDKLGGPHCAAQCLRTYLRWPRWTAPHRFEAIYFLMHCGAPAAPVLEEMATDEDEQGRLLAIDVLRRIRASKEPEE